MQALVRKYAFAIVFENSIVHDYVSEKVYGALQARSRRVVCRMSHVACIALPAQHRILALRFAVCTVSEKVSCASAR